MTNSAETFALAWQHHQANQLAEAERLYRHILLTDPSHADAWCFLGALCHAQGNSSEAEACFRRAVDLVPSFVTAHNYLGIVVAGQGKLEEAAASFQQALRWQPRDADAWNNLGLIRQKQGRFDEAQASYQQALQLMPNLARAHNNLGNVFQFRGRLAEAKACYQEAVRHEPNLAEAHTNLAGLYASLSQPVEALASYERALALGHQDALRIKQALVVPVIAQSREEIQQWRGRLQENLARLLQENLHLQTPVGQIGATNFYFAYHGLNDRELQAQIAAIYSRACPALDFVAPHCLPSTVAPSRSEPIRIGFISHFFSPHSITQHYAGIIRHLSRDRFRVRVFCLAGPRGTLAEFSEPGADKVVMLTPHEDLDALRRPITEQRLDVLCYTDIGMSAWTYFLAFARLAPVQCVLAGHPVTTGIPTIDYFVSSKDVEPADAREHYTEALVQLSSVPSYFVRPQLSGPPRTRRDFGLVDEDHLYLCVQMLFKIHPDFDDLAAAILQADPKGRIVLVQGPHDAWTEALRQRLRRRLGTGMDRVLFLPQQGYDRYLQLLTLADVLLDTPHFSGGTTSFQALGLGVPIVTLPGKFMRGRVTYGCYQRMGLADCIAADAADYARIAVRLATEPAWREQVCSRIRAAAHVLFENEAVIGELEQFFVEAVARVRAVR